MTLDTTHYKERLEEMTIVLTNELAELGIHNPTNPDDWIAIPENVQDESDPIDTADRVEDWNERVATLAELETRYNNIQHALKRIESGEYGTCEVSGEPIEVERLDANPAARTCIAHMDEEVNLPD